MSKQKEWIEEEHAGMGSKSTEGNNWTDHQQGTTYVGQEQQK